MPLPAASRAHFLMPGRVWRAFLIGCVPLYTVYFVVLFYEALQGRVSNLWQTLGTANLNNDLVPRADNSLVVLDNDGTVVRRLAAPMPKVLPRLSRSATTWSATTSCPRSIKHSTATATLFRSCRMRRRLSRDCDAFGSARPWCLFA